MTEHELFKEAVMQYLVDDAQVKRASKAHKRHPAVRRILVTAACLLAAAGVTVFSIPSARAAVEDWINDWFSPGGYFGQQKEERAKEPTIEAIITKAGGNNTKITEVGKGYEAYANAFDMTLDEIAYDGETIFVSGTMSGATARPFVEAQTGGDTFRAAKFDNPQGSSIYDQYCFCACENFVNFVTKDGQQFHGEIVPAFTEEMDAIAVSLVNKEPEVVFENGVLVTSNKEADALWDAYLANHDVRFSMELESNGQDAPLSGMVSGELSFRMEYPFADGFDTVPLLKASIDSITIDANAYQQQTQTTQAKDDLRVDLGGVHPATIEAWQPESERTSNDCETYTYTRELDFTGASVSLKEISFTPTDTKITMHVVLPESWTGAERCYAGLTFKFLLDEETPENALEAKFCVEGPRGTADQTGKALEYDCPFYESTLSPSQWASAKTLTIIPTTEYWWEMLVNYDDEPYKPFSLRDDAVFTGIANHSGVQNEILYDKMTQYAITINLDDYR